MTKPIRPAQNNNRRMKNNRNGRRSSSQNPMSRNYDSNGPEVKIRGNASHIAEKYTQLARDANSSGDPIKAENYWQHAEHYNRIILAFQAQREENNARKRAQNAAAEEQSSEEETTEAKASEPQRKPRRRKPRNDQADREKGDVKNKEEAKELPDEIKETLTSSADPTVSGTDELSTS